jgi:hypothetical protein
MWVGLDRTTRFVEELTDFQDGGFSTIDVTVFDDGERWVFP